MNPGGETEAGNDHLEDEHLLEAVKNEIVRRCSGFAWEDESFQPGELRSAVLQGRSGGEPSCVWIFDPRVQRGDFPMVRRLLFDYRVQYGETAFLTLVLPVGAFSGGETERIEADLREMDKVRLFLYRYRPGADGKGLSLIEWNEKNRKKPLAAGQEGVSPEDTVRREPSFFSYAQLTAGELAAFFDLGIEIRYASAEI